MRHETPAARAAAVVLAIALTACDDGIDPTDRARVNEVILSPEDTVLEHPDSFRYDVLLLDPNGDPIDESRPMDFTPSDFDVVTVTDGGFVRTREAGSVEVSALVGGTTGTASIEVTDTE